MRWAVGASVASLIFCILIVKKGYLKMNSKFENVMAQRTDSDLMEIVTITRDEYQPEALAAAEAELKKREYLRRFLPIADLTIEDLFEHPRKQDINAAVYCPLCEVEFIEGIDLCPDCDLNLVRFSQ